MRWPRIILLILIAILFGGFLNYTLPDRDVVRIVETDNRRVDFSALTRFFYTGGDAGGGVSNETRDVLFVRALTEDGRVRVYRNEDTGLFGWPPFFKTRSDNWQTVAANLQSTEAEPRWVVIRHYGWRFPEWSIFPNVLSVREVESPDVTLFPWGNLIVLLVLGGIVFGIWRLWERFIDRFIDPIVDRVAVRWAKLRDWVSGRGGN